MLAEASNATDEVLVDSALGLLLEASDWESAETFEAHKCARNEL